MKSYPYYPGCSVKGTGKAYEESLLAVFEALGVKLEEIDDWNCCGATAYMSIDETEACALAGRNLAIAEKAGNGAGLVAPCNACYLVLNKTKKLLEEQPKMRDRVAKALRAAGLEYTGKMNVRHPLEVLVNDIGTKAIKEKVTKPLNGLRVAPYYGCQIVRPYALFDDQYNPTTMDVLIKATGAEAVVYPFKTRCCGASQTSTIPETGLHLVYMLIKEAHHRGADMIATICPLCQFNLEGYQHQVCEKYKVDPIPVVYFTQLMGLALGLSAEKVGLNRSLVPAEPVLKRRVANAA
jgi:heterodisulfide reductase subunit B